MNEELFRKTMVRYLEDHGIWSEIIPIIMETADRTPGGLMELAYFVLDQGKRKAAGTVQAAIKEA